MASEIINQIDGTERLCDERVAAAQNHALEVIAQAKERAAQRKAEAIGQARREADEIMAAANDAAKKTLEAAAAQSEAKIAEMRKSAEGNTAVAVNAVAKRLVEWN